MSRGGLWGMEFFIAVSATLTLLVAYLAFRSNKTSERIVKLQIIGEAIDLAKALQFEPLFWSGHAKGMENYRYKQLQSACRDCERLKVYFSNDTMELFDNVRRSALMLLSNVVVIIENNFNDTPEEDKKLSAMRQDTSDCARVLLTKLDEARKKNYIKMH